MKVSTFSSEISLERDFKEKRKKEKEDTKRDNKKNPEERDNSIV